MKGGPSPVFIAGVVVALIAGLGWWFTKDEGEAINASGSTSSAQAPSTTAQPAAALSAKEVLNEILGLARDNRWAEVPEKVSALKALTAMPQGNRQEARSQLDSALALAGSDQVAAEELLMKAVSLDPSFPNIRFELANVLFRQGKVESASTTLVDGLVIGPDVGRGWLVAAEIFAETNKSEAAVSALKLAVYYANNRDKALEYLKAADQTVASEPLKTLIKSVLPSLAGVPKSR